MKALYLLSLLSLATMTCQGQPQPAVAATESPLLKVVNNNIRRYVQAYSADPGSYTPLETRLLDTVYFTEMVPKKRNDTEDLLRTYQQKLINDRKEVELYKKQGIYETNKDVAKSLIDNDLKMIQHLKSEKILIQVAVDSIARSPNRQPVCAYLGIHVFRLKDRTGAVQQYKFALEVNPQGDLLIFADNPERIEPYPNFYGNTPLVVLPK